GAATGSARIYSPGDLIVVRLPRCAATLPVPQVPEVPVARGTGTKPLPDARRHLIFRHGPAGSHHDICNRATAARDQNPRREVPRFVVGRSAELRVKRKLFPELGSCLLDILNAGGHVPGVSGGMVAIGVGLPEHELCQWLDRPGANWGK